MSYTGSTPHSSKKFIVSLLVAALIFMVGITTLAWFTDHDSRASRFLPTTSSIGSIIEEVFVPDPAIVPVEVQEKVKITNTEWADN